MPKKRYKRQALGMEKTKICGYQPDMELNTLSTEKHILIAGATASGKSALALEIAQRYGGVIVNADAIQVYDAWRILTARPSVEDEATAPHRLYGHIAKDAPYSVGHWLREIEPLLHGPERLIIVGGTGLYFTALTQGLAPIPDISPQIRQQAIERFESLGLDALIRDLDDETKSKLDLQNPMRVMRAWEVQQQTGHSIIYWQKQTPKPILTADRYEPILFRVEKERLNSRIVQRFDNMVELGLLDEARQNVEAFEPQHGAHKAIGAQEIVNVIKGQIDLPTAREQITIATRQFAKRQRTWFNSKMQGWQMYGG